MDALAEKWKALSHPTKLGTLADIMCAQDSRGTGVYAWWIKRLPSIVPLDGARELGDYHLVYVGKTESTLRRRVRTHYNGCASHSTLRKSLGVWLQDQLGLVMEIVRWTVPKRATEKKPRFGWGATEARLTEWMTENARVVWLHCEDFKAVEASIINAEHLPLNLKDNTRHPFYPMLFSLRQKAETKALADYRKSGGGIPR